MFQLNVSVGFNPETLQRIDAFLKAINAESTPVANGSAKKETPVKSIAKPATGPTNGQDTVKEIKLTVEQLRLKTTEVAKANNKAKKPQVDALIAEACEGVDGKPSVSLIPEENYQSYYAKLTAL